MKGAVRVQGWGRDSPCDGQREQQLTGHQRDKVLPLTKFNDLAENKEAGPESDYGTVAEAGEAQTLL